MADGPGLARHGADYCAVVAVLHEVLAIEIVCMLNYQRQYHRINILQPGAVAAKFLDYAAQQQVRLGLVAKRIVALGGAANFAPSGLPTRSQSEVDAYNSIEELVRDNLVAERVAVSTYTEVAHWLGDSDVKTRRIMEKLMADEEEHADDLVAFLARIARPEAPPQIAPRPRLHRPFPGPDEWTARSNNTTRIERKTSRDRRQVRGPTME